MVSRRVATALTLLLALLAPAAWAACNLCAGCPADAQRPDLACHEAPASSLTSDCCASARAAEPAPLGAAAASPVLRSVAPAAGFLHRFEDVPFRLSVATPTVTAPAAVPLFTLHSALLI
jgi:hypothetical protein